MQTCACDRVFDSASELMRLCNLIFCSFPLCSPLPRLLRMQPSLCRILLRPRATAAGVGTEHFCTIVPAMAVKWSGQLADLAWSAAVV